MTKVSIHRFFPGPRSVAGAIVLGLGLLTIGAISPPPTPNSAMAETLPRSQGERLTLALGQVNELWTTVLRQPPGNLVAISRYLPDADCDGFETEPAIADPQQLESVVQGILRDSSLDLVALELTGYRVQREGGGTVTIDLRVAPNSQRQLVSLSSCEQMLLFGSLRRTLLDNPALAIETLRFTERGQPVEL